MKTEIEKLCAADEEISRLENINRIQQKQIERLMDTRDADRIVIAIRESLLDEAIHVLEHGGLMAQTSVAFRDYRGTRNTELTKRADLPADKWRD